MAKDFPYLHYVIPDADIITTTNYDTFGNRESYDYAWEGKENGIVGISLFRVSKEEDEMISTHGRIVIGPYHLRIIGQGNFGQMAYAVRDGRRAAIKVRQMKLVCLLNKIYRRIIITCSVWGLADYNEAVIPTWHDVRVLRKLVGWLGDPLGALPDECS